MKKIVAVLGDAIVEKGSEKYQTAYEIGKRLVDEGYRVQCGGLGGVMTAVCEGARASENYTEGDTIGLVPSFDREKANEYVDIVIPTGLDLVRNALTGNADAVIAIGGGAGTLSEMAIAWSIHRLIIAFRTFPGWAQNLADKRLDSRQRYPEIPDDRVYGVDTPDEAISIIREKMHLYTRSFEGISHINPKG